MTNIYWPVFKSIESEFEKLMYSIHIDDRQLNVYSTKISDLILRSSIEIESISKELYKQNGGNKAGQIKYDEDALKYLNKIWHLEKKVVFISSFNCFLSEKELNPFVKNEERSKSKRLTYSWNNAYQNLKHDRAGSLKFGSIKYLFDIMAALYLLNIYYKDEIIELGENVFKSSLDESFGSSIFSINVHRTTTLSTNGILLKNLLKNEDFIRSTYIIIPTEETAQIEINAIKEMNRLNQKYTEEHILKVLNEKIEKAKPMIISQEKMNKIALNEKDKVDQKNFQRAYYESPMKIERLKFQAVLNKN